MSKIKTVLQFEKIIKNVPIKRTYSEVEMNHSFESGYERCRYNYSGQSDEEYVPSFQEFIQSLNTPKP